MYVLKFYSLWIFSFAIYFNLGKFLHFIEFIWYIFFLWLTFFLLNSMFLRPIYTAVHTYSSLIFCWQIVLNCMNSTLVLNMCWIVWVCVWIWIVWICVLIYPPGISHLYISSFLLFSTEHSCTWHKEAVYCQVKARTLFWKAHLKGPIV